MLAPPEWPVLLQALLAQAVLVQAWPAVLVQAWPAVLVQAWPAAPAH
jgi:hypothetical protein